MMGNVSGVGTPIRAAALVLTTAGVLSIPAAAQPPGSAAPVPVAVERVELRELVAEQEFVGTVMPLRRSTIGSAVDERVVEFPVNEGDHVQEGDVLAVLRTRTPEIELAAARAELEVRQQELAELENGTRPEELEQGRARLARARSLRDISQIRSRRAMSLRQSRSASSEELEEALAEAEQADREYQEAQAALDLLVAGPRVEQIARARAQVLVQQETVNRLEDLIDRHTIVAPFDGYIVAEHTEVGQWVARGQPIVEMIELDTVEITVPVLEDYIRYLTPGASVEVQPGALPGETFAGEIAHVVPQADLRSRSFPVKVRVENQKGTRGVLLKAGMFTRVRLPISEPRQALLVDKDAVVLQGSAPGLRYPLVFVVDALPGSPSTGRARAVSVTTGAAEEGLMEVVGSLEQGQLVIVQGNERLTAGQVVEFAEPPTTTAARAGSSTTAPGSSPPR